MIIKRKSLCITFGNRNRGKRHALKSEKRWTWSPLVSCTHPQPSVWSVSNQSGKRVQRTGWKALLTSKTAMQLRAARPMCGSGTLVKRSWSWDRRWSRDLYFCFIVSTPPTDLHPSVMWIVIFSPIVDFASCAFFCAIKFNDFSIKSLLQIAQKLILWNYWDKCSFAEFFINKIYISLKM